jgi:hypothetical protein
MRRDDVSIGHARPPSGDIVMQTAIAFSRALRQAADKQRAMEQAQASQRLHGLSARLDSREAPKPASGATRDAR